MPGWQQNHRSKARHARRPENRLGNLVSCLKLTSVLKYGVKRHEGPPETLTIGILAETAGVNVETIRFYQRKGLMQEPERPQGGIRRYGETDLARVRFIKSAQRLGFSLDEVADLLKLEDESHCPEAREQAERKLTDVRAKLADLQRIEAVLVKLVQHCSAARGQVRCPMIQALQEA